MYVFQTKRDFHDGQGKVFGCKTHFETKYGCLSILITVRSETKDSSAKRCSTFLVNYYVLGFRVHTYVCMNLCLNNNILRIHINSGCKYAVYYGYKFSKVENQRRVLMSFETRSRNYMKTPA